MAYKFPIETYPVLERCPFTGQWVERLSDTLEHIAQIDHTLRDTFGDYFADKFMQCLNRAEGLHTGRNRATLLMGKYVIKFPLCGDGVADNDWEGSISGGDYIQYARTRLAYVGDVPIVFMEQVEYAKVNYDAMPDWVGSVDCGQVGYTRKGKLVAYDYGIR